MSPRPTEVKLVTALLGEDSDDARALAAEIIEALDAARAKRPQYTAIMYDPNARMTFAFGPYATPNRAGKEMDRLASPGPLPSRGIVLQMRAVPE